MIESKVLVSNKEWLLRSPEGKLGAVAKAKKGYVVIKDGKEMKFDNLSQINSTLGITISEENALKIKQQTSEVKDNYIYDYPCSYVPHEPVYNIHKKLPLFFKSSKSKSRYCAGYYLIKFRKGWVKSFCPKLITLERYPYQGPFKTETEARSMLNMLNKL